MPTTVYASFARQTLQVFWERIVGDRPTVAEHRTLELAKRVRPDVLLCLTWDLHPAILDEMRMICPSRRILWWGDAPGNSRRWGIMNPGWDRVYLKDRD